DRRRRLSRLRLPDRLLPGAQGAQPAQPDRALHHRAGAVLDELPGAVDRVDIPAEPRDLAAGRQAAVGDVRPARADPALHPVHDHTALLHALAGRPHRARGCPRPRRELVADLPSRDPAPDDARDRHRRDLHLRSDDGRVRDGAGRRPELHPVGRHDHQLVHHERRPVPAGRRGGDAARASADRRGVRDHPLLEPQGGPVTSAALETPARPQDRVIRRETHKRDWGKVGLAGYYLVFLVFLYGPMIVMANLSFQGYYGGITFPFVGPVGLNWWRALIHSTVANTPTHAADIQTAAVNSLKLSLAAGVIVAFLAFTL